MNSELKNKHSEKRKLKKGIKKKICIELERNLSLMVLSTVCFIKYVLPLKADLRTLIKTQK